RTPAPVQQPIGYRTGPTVAVPPVNRPAPPRVETGPRPQITLGPPALAHELTPPPGPPSDQRGNRTRRLLLAAGAVVIVALAVALPWLPPHHGHNKPQQQAGPPDTSSPVPNGTCSGNVASCIPDSTLRSYISPTYSEIASCDPNTALGASLPA